MGYKLWVETEIMETLSLKSEVLTHSPANPRHNPEVLKLSSKRSTAPKATADQTKCDTLKPMRLKTCMPKCPEALMPKPCHVENPWALCAKSKRSTRSPKPSNVSRGSERTCGSRASRPHRAALAAAHGPVKLEDAM